MLSYFFDIKVQDLNFSKYNKIMLICTSFVHSYQGYSLEETYHE